MVKSVIGVNHQGLSDWLIQRISALVMAVYTLGLLAYFFMHPDLDYASWHMLFSQAWVKVATILFILSLLFHAWVGIWTIFTDYIKFAWLRLILHVLVFFALLTCFFAGLMILWGL